MYKPNKKYKVSAKNPTKYNKFMEAYVNSIFKNINFYSPYNKIYNMINSSQDITGCF